MYKLAVLGKASRCFAFSLFVVVVVCVRRWISYCFGWIFHFLFFLMNFVCFVFKSFDLKMIV